MRTDLTSTQRAVLLLVLALSLTGCATQWVQPKPVQPVRLPPPPAELMQPPSSGSWSESVQQLFRRWQKLLTPGTPA